MNITINGSNSLDKLAFQLCKELKSQQNHVFQPQYVVTQTEGMNNWLKIRMAEHLGIVANCRFVKPNDLINEIYYRLGAASKQSLSPGTLQWVLFTILASKEFQDKYRKIANYYTNDDVKRMALAEKTADLFDQYQIYRPDMIRKWNDGNSDFDGNNGWQNYLWIKAKEVLGTTMPDKTVVGKHIAEALTQSEQQKRLTNAIPNIHVFGLSIITAYHVQLFYELSRVINVSIHLLNPAPSIYWQEDKSEKQVAVWRQKSNIRFTDADLKSTGNALLTSWGKILQDTFGLFFESDELIDQYNEVGAEEPLAETLLGKIQNDVFNNHENDDRNEIYIEDISDGSLTINSCYTPAREVEVLYNYLVHLVDKARENLSPREVVVMVSDIDTYAPYIKAVFHSGPHKFPFTIADESFNISDNIFSALQSILTLSDENFKAEEVLQLLESSFIRSRFGITNIDLNRKAVDAANIRFGIDGSKSDDTVYVSWKNGINRIMYGICMSGKEEYSVDGLTTYPLDMTEGVEAFELIRFCHFAEVLISTIEERNRVRTIAEWGEYIEQVVDRLICQAEDNTDEDYQLLLQNLERLYLLDDLVKDKVSYEVFKHNFIGSLAGESRTSSFASGGITFCSLIPMRSIPFKVVAMLGLDFDKFPRKETRVSFNIIEQDKRRKGDRNVKENDKHLFLETVLSAQKYLYISYLGRSSKDNTPKPPSVLVDELIDYIQSGVGDDTFKVREHLITTHPLHNFSQKYQQKTPGLYNYLKEKEAKSERTEASNESEVSALNFEEVNIESFISFFKNPFKAYYNNVLGIRYETDEVLLPENEIFEVEGLQKWQLKQDLLFMENEQLDSYRNKGIATGNLPLKHMANYALTTTETGLMSVKELVNDCIDESTEESLNIELTVDNTILKGKLNRIYKDRLIQISFSKIECKYLLEGYIRYLLATASGVPVELNYISATKNKVYKITSTKRSEATALQTLGKLMKFYKQGHEQILMFYPDFNKSPEDISAMTRDKFDNMVKTFFDKSCYDPYIEKAKSYGFFKEEGVYEEYIEMGREIFEDEKEFYVGYYSK